MNVEENCLHSNIQAQLASIAKPYLSIKKIVLFGSRARGDFCRVSDFDICIFCENEQDFTNYYFDVEEIDTFYKIDVLRYSDFMNDTLKNEIAKDGIVFYEREEQ